MLRYLRYLLAIALLATGSVAWSQTLNLAHERVLVITHASPDWPDGGVSDLTEKLLRHFTPHTQVLPASDYKAGAIDGYTKVVVLGLGFAMPMPEPLLADLLATDKTIVWMGYAVGQVVSRTAKFGFKEDDFHETQSDPPVLVYEGKAYPTNLHGYSRVHVTDPATRIWSVLRWQGEIVPHVLQGGNMWFVNSVPDLDWTPNPTIAPTLVLADLLHEVFKTGVARKPRAVLRLEDVSTHIPPARLERLVDYLEGAKVPFAIALIPNQRLGDGSVEPLAEKLRLVRTLRRAQNRARATIVLHGFFHTFGTGEDYEFWDEVKDAPLAGETRDLYACKLTHGIRILRDLGLEPRYWETPHYAASPLGYKTFAEFFSHVIENRREESWTPYPHGPDQYGQTLIHENLGYIAPAEGRTVERQLERARLLQIVRNAWAVGFVHPAVVPVREVERLVKGLRELGYEFADVSEIKTMVNSDYRPSAAREYLTAAILVSRVNLPMIGRWLGSAAQAATSAAFAASAWAGFEPARKAGGDPCEAILSERPPAPPEQSAPVP